MARTKKRHAALALLEFESIASGIATCDAMVKRAPIALLRCGTIHPGRYLALIGGSGGSTEEAYRAGLDRAEVDRTLRDAVLLSDIHPQLHDAVLGPRHKIEHAALAVIETTASPALLAAIDAALKSTPVELIEIRLADDLGGRAVALVSGGLTDAATAIEVCVERAGNHLLSTALLPRLDGNLRQVLDQGTAFGPCAALEPEGAEHPEEIPCCWVA